MGNNPNRFALIQSAGSTAGHAHRTGRSGAFAGGGRRGREPPAGGGRRSVRGSILYWKDCRRKNQRQRPGYLAPGPGPLSGSFIDERLRSRIIACV